LIPELPDRARQTRPTCVARSSLPRFARLANLPLVYEITGRRAEFAIDERFAGQLQAWLTDLIRLTGWQPRQLWTYGTWIDGGRDCSSWHHAGRAFDLARLRLVDDEDVSCRYDRWRSQPAGALSRARRRYWAVAASAHQHFAYVLTYLYDDQHHNHIHLDNGRSGSGPSSFSGRSPAQIQALQAILTYLWSAPVEITGSWDGATRDAVRVVLGELDLAGDLTDQPAWSAFLTASVRRGAQLA
jgi:hypothetical protein